MSSTYTKQCIRASKERYIKRHINFAIVTLSLEAIALLLLAKEVLLVRIIEGEWPWISILDLEQGQQTGDILRTILGVMLASCFSFLALTSMTVHLFVLRKQVKRWWKITTSILFLPLILTNALFFFVVLLYWGLLTGFVDVARNYQEFTYILGIPFWLMTFMLGVPIALFAAAQIVRLVWRMLRSIRR